MSQTNVLFPSLRVFALSVVACCCVLAASCGSSSKVGIQTLSSTLYARSDTNATTVWSPRLRAGAKVGDSASLESTVAIDSWTGASIDVTTAATKAVHEVRKEVTAGGGYEFSDVTIGGGYRYSTENDYWSNGGVGNISIDMANNNTTLAGAVFGSKDTVGRSHDPNFKKPQSSLGGRMSLTQVIDVKSVIMLSWETAQTNGYQASPYRFVAVGGNGPGLCAGLAPLCLPETVPAKRTRNAAVGRYRRALGEHLSVGLEYRLYFDDWGVLSHTISPDVAVLVGEHGTLNLSYRYYTQGQADFYRKRYLDPTGDLQYLTRDRELSSLYSSRVGFGYMHDFELGEGDTVLTAAFRGGLTRFVYRAFVGLTSVDALEGTFLLSLGWR